LAYWELPYAEETLGTNGNQRVAKLTKIAGRWKHYTERKGNRRGGGMKMEGVLSSPPRTHTYTRTHIQAYTCKEYYLFLSDLLHTLLPLP
jgi:hypothetical protein